ncbi:MAG: S41 family peptidase, partial [Clostridia bacterium]|nr:S41 family peptidase [Clostridia bacterium]
VAKVRGEEGTQVEITYRRDGAEKTVSIIRMRIYNESLDARIIGNNVGYVYIDNFQTNADKEFVEKVTDLVEKGVKALVFDVRFNGGGYVSVMNNMLDVLLPEGTVISMVDKAGNTKEFKSDASAIELPMVVITNEYSISAAEFFAAALQEYGVAKIVGDPTGGKGYSQNLFMLKDGSSVNLSTSRYYTPKGESLVDHGVVPDVPVSLTDEETANFYNLTDAQDKQLQAALSTVDKMAK